MAWEEPTFDSSADGITQEVLDNLQDALDGWQPYEGDPLTALAEETSRQSAATRELVVEGLSVAAAVGVGATLLNLAPRTASPAVISDVALELQLGPEAGVGAGSPPTLDQSVTIPAGFQIVADTGSDQVAYELASDLTTTVTFTQESTGVLEGYYTATLHVAMEATTAGTVGNIPAGTLADVVTSHPVVASATIDADATGGVDEESLPAYLDRLIDYVSLLRPGGVTARDLALFARTVNGVHRALAIDLYDPSDGSTDNERTVTVIPIDADGQPLASTTELVAALEAIREVNFVIHVAEPTYTGVDIVVNVVAKPGVDPAAVDAEVTAAVVALIDPASWGSTEEEPQSWTEQTSLRVFDVAGVVFDVDGVASVTSITLNGGTSTVTLDGPGALPSAVDADTDPSTVTVNVT